VRKLFLAHRFNRSGAQRTAVLADHRSEEMEGHRFQYMATIVAWLAERARLRVPETADVP
jgi:hypothetical protein